MKRKPFSRVARRTLIVLAVVAISLGIFVYLRVRPTLLEYDLLAACSSGDAERAEQSLNAGADPNREMDAAYGFGNTGLTRYGDLAEALVGHSLHQINRVPPLTFAAFSGHANVVLVLIKRGANIEETDTQATGMTPLMAAVTNNQADVVRMLITHGANVKARYKDGSTILEDCQSPDIIALLKAAGAV